MKNPFEWRRGLLALALACVSLLPQGCGFGGGDDGAEAVAERFAIAYFNYHFDEASLCCTPESRRWLSFAASNVYEADLDVLRGMASGAEVEVLSVDYGDADSVAVASVVVRGAMVRDTIGRAGRVSAEESYRLGMVCRDGRWYVRMEGLPRSGK